MQWNTMHDARKTLANRGYEPGLPAGLNVEAPKYDHDCVVRSTCRRCKFKTMRATFWRKKAAYRTVGYCATCGHTRMY